MESKASIGQFVRFTLALLAIASVVLYGAGGVESWGWRGLALPAVFLAAALLWHLGERRWQRARAGRRGRPGAPANR